MIRASKHARVDVDAAGIACVEIAQAGALNILSTPVIEDLTRVLDELSVRDELRVLVLRGSGDKAFVGGADIKEMARLERASAERFIGGLRRLCDAVRLFPVPVIARIPGWALGGGLELALACDLRIAAHGARFGMPEVRVGIPSVIHAALLPRLIGGARANWLMLTGENIDAEQALAWGLIDKRVALAELDAEVGRLAQQLARYGTQALRQQKRLLRRWEDAPVDQSIAESIAEFGKAYDSGEPQRYMREFVARVR